MPKVRHKKRNVNPEAGDRHPFESTSTRTVSAKKQLLQFAACVFEPSDIIELRLLGPGGSVQSRWLCAGRLGKRSKWLAKWNAAGRNIFIGGNPRIRKGGGANAQDCDGGQCGRCNKCVKWSRCLFVDFDNIDVGEALRRIDEANLPRPTLILLSGRGVHCYWRLKKPMTDLRRWTLLQKSLITELRSDPVVHDLARIMRLPGFANLKYESQPMSKIIESNPDRVYEVKDFELAIADGSGRQRTHTTELSPKGMERTSQRWLKQALRKAEKGNRNNIGFWLACQLRDAGIALSRAEQTLRQYADEQEPDYSTTEALATVKSAYGRAPRKAAPSATMGRRKAALIPTQRPFPVDALPEPIRGFVTNVTVAVGCDVSLAVLPALAMLASCIGNSRRISIKKGWTEPALLWAVVIAESGEKKTPAFRAVLAPLRKLQLRLAEEHRKEMGSYESDLLKYEKELKAWRSAKSNGDPPEKPDVPVAERVIINDTTFEALAPILLDNWRGGLLHRDELSAWFGSFDRYAASRGSDCPNWLSIFSTEPITIDRKGGNPKTIHVPLPNVSITGTIQPGTLAKILTSQYRENGLAARFLFAQPPRLPRGWSDAEVPKSAEVAFARIVHRLRTLHPGTYGDGKPRPILCSLTKKARARFAKFVDRHNAEQVRLVGPLAAAWSKLEGYAARFALVVHCVRWAADDPTLKSLEKVDAESVAAGVELVSWFGNEARRVYALMSESTGDSRQRRLIEWITVHGGSVTVRDVSRGKVQFRGDRDAAQAALDELVEAGYGKWCVFQKSARGGRPVRRFQLFDTGDGDRTAVAACP